MATQQEKPDKPPAKPVVRYAEKVAKNLLMLLVVLLLLTAYPWGLCLFLPLIVAGATAGIALDNDRNPEQPSHEMSVMQVMVRESSIMAHRKTRILVPMANVALVGVAVLSCMMPTGLLTAALIAVVGYVTYKVSGRMAALTLNALDSDDEAVMSAIIAHVVCVVYIAVPILLRTKPPEFYREQFFNSLLYLESSIWSLLIGLL